MLPKQILPLFSIRLAHFTFLYIQKPSDRFFLFSIRHRHSASYFLSKQQVLELFILFQLKMPKRKAESETDYLKRKLKKIQRRLEKIPAESVTPTSREIQSETEDIVPGMHS